MKYKFLTVNDVIPGKLVVHRYTPEIGVIISANWQVVELLLCNGKIIKWGFESFRSAYEIA